MVLIVRKLSSVVLRAFHKIMLQSFSDCLLHIISDYIMANDYVILSKSATLSTMST